MIVFLGDKLLWHSHI